MRKHPSSGSSTHLLPSEGEGNDSDQVFWIYRRLFQHFGPQGWWPVTPKGGQVPVYAPGRRRLTETQRFEIALGAILTQNTAWTNVEKALAGLIKAKALSPAGLLKLSPGRLQRLIRPSGYFRQKAKRLRLFARFLMRETKGKMTPVLRRSLSRARQTLLGLHGVGPETADSILLYAGGRPQFVVDAYTRRVGRRFGLFKTEDYHAIQEFFTQALPRQAGLFQEYHALLVALAKKFCRPQPLCGTCPLSARCLAP